MRTSTILGTKDRISLIKIDRFGPIRLISPVQELEGPVSLLLVRRISLIKTLEQRAEAELELLGGSLY